MSRKRKAPIRKVYADPKFKSEIISKFIKLWQPRLAVFVESEIWPNMIMQSSKQCKLILLNCRISKKSFNKWKIIRKTFKAILEKFDVILAQGKITSNYLNHFGIKRGTYYVQHA